MVNLAFCCYCFTFDIISQTTLYLIALDSFITWVFFKFQTPGLACHHQQRQWSGCLNGTYIHQDTDRDLSSRPSWMY